MKWIVSGFVALILCVIGFQSFAATGSASQQVPSILDGLALKNVDPCTDFYQFSCGTWIEQTVIPENKRAVSRQTTFVLDQTDAKLNQLLLAYASGNYSTPATEAVALGQYYKSCLEVEKTQSTNVQYLQKQIIMLKNLKSIAELPRIIAQEQMAGFDAFFSFASLQNPNDSNSIIGNLAQGGQGLPDRDYYLNKDAKSELVRTQYKAYIAKLFQLFGSSAADGIKTAKVILDLETRLASVSLSIADRYDADKTNHPVTLQQVKAAAPLFDWEIYFKTQGMNANQLAKMNLEVPAFFNELNRILQTQNVKDLSIYLIWKLLDGSADKLGGIYEQTHFQFWKTQLNGSKQMLPRWQACTQAVENDFGYALAEAYVKTFDGAKIKEKTKQMITQVKQAFEADLADLSQGANAWLDLNTYNSALEKIRLMTQKVGGPEKWRNYSKLEKPGPNFLFNSVYINRFEARRDKEKIAQPVDRTEWYMMPWEINAYYDPSSNEFNFPFGILQPPSVDLTASDGANLGSFGGGTIGHELTHGFDNSGSQYDGHGNLRNWWSPATKDQFEKRSQCFIQQADAYKIKEVDLTVNGEQTLTENLADQGGVKLGYMALDKVLASRPEGQLWLNRYTERQQFWIAYAQSWCTKARPESLRVQMTSDPHPPAEFRVNAIVMNRPEFARDFKCAAGSPMAPANRCSIW